MSENKEYEIDYGCFKVNYRIEEDETPLIIITGIWINSPCADDIAAFDKADWDDVKFHCRSDFSDRQYKHYIATGETL